MESLVWYDHTIHFVSTPGHTSCSNVIFVDDIMFSGDTILKDTRPFIQKKHGGDKEQFKKSVSSILKSVEKEQLVYPGHGEPFKFGEVYEYYSEYILQ